MALGLCRDLVAGSGELDAIDVLLCPPATLLHRVSEAVAGSAIATGAQDINEHESGAYTGEVSAAMVLDAGGRFTIIGHSERRTLYRETDERVAAKVTAAVDQGLTPVVCVGETREERENGRTDSVVLGQLDAVIDHCGIDVFDTGVIAYEPVWAIGTGLTATPEQAQAVHGLIRRRLAERQYRHRGPMPYTVRRQHEARERRRTDQPTGYRWRPDRGRLTEFE